MSWQEKYLSPSIESEKITWNRVKSYSIRFFILLRHALSPHQIPKDPQIELPDITTENQNLFAICSQIYNASHDRISKLEQKAFNMLSYITAFFAFISFIFLQFIRERDSFLFTLIFIIVLIFLILAIIVSFRCLSLKHVKSIFLSNVYDFDKSEQLEVFDEKKICKSYLQSSVHNENVSDNTADMLNASRQIFLCALVLGLFASIYAIAYNHFVPSKSKTPISVDNAEIVKEVKNLVKTTNDIMIDMKLKITDHGSFIVNADKKIQFFNNKLEDLENMVISLQKENVLIKDKVNMNKKE